jgi:putative transposase
MFSLLGPDSEAQFRLTKSGEMARITERGGTCGFDAHKRVRGRKRHILVDTLGLEAVKSSNQGEPQT